MAKAFETTAFENTAFEAASGGGAATATPSGVSTTASVGTATVSAQVNRVPTGVAATSAVGTATAQGQQNVSGLPSGVSATGSIGTPTAKGASNVVPLGVFGTAAVGSATASGGGAVNATATPDGVEALGQVGTPTVDTGTGDNQAIGAFRIYNLKKRKKKDRVPLILDIETNIPYNEPSPAQSELIEPVQAGPVVTEQPVNARRLSADRWMTAPVVAVRVAPKRAPIQTLATAEDERLKRNRRAVRLLLLAS